MAIVKPIALALVIMVVLLIAVSYAAMGWRCLRTGRWPEEEEDNPESTTTLRRHLGDVVSRRLARTTGLLVLVFEVCFIGGIVYALVLAAISAVVE